ncbi:hypothetical protein [Clostridium sp. JN-1]|uniref:hypothetical protein n=1 Tax=Clostridium sp. JN-1 TaxID=2483110 RepID=UPI001FAA7684|nr:hypothetical protein [Clostridium sp. JN-1]
MFDAEEVKGYSKLGTVDIMIKRLFEKAAIKITYDELEEVLQITTDDIRENRIKFGKRTSLEQMVTIALRVYCVLKKVA